MRFDGKNTKQKADQISITKLSTVVRPAHEGAVAAIIKSAAVTTEEIEKQQFMEALAEIQLEEMMEEFFETVWDMTWALRNSIRDTIQDDEITNKKEVIQNSISDFATALSSAVSATNVIKQGESDMKKEEIEAMLKAAIDPLQAKLTTAEAVAKMNDVTKSHYESLDDDGKVEFIKLSVEEQIEAATPKNVNKGAVDDESFDMNGKTILKSAVGAGAYDVLKAQHEENQAIKADLKKEREARKQAEYAKMAEGLYPNLPGEPMAKGKVISALKSMDKETQDTLEAMLKAGNKAMLAAHTFKSSGIDTYDTDDDSPEAKLNKMAKEKADKDGISFAKAYDAILRTERGQELYEEAMSQ